MTRRSLLSIIGLCVVLSGCGATTPSGAVGYDEPVAPAQTSDVNDEEENMPKPVISNVRINEELLEPMMISSDIDRGEIARRAEMKLRVFGQGAGFPEYHDLPTPESCVAGMSVKESAPFVYIYRMAEGEANFDEAEMLSAVLAYLSTVESCGFRVEVIESATYIYSGGMEVAHFVLAGTAESGYLMYLQIVA